MATRPTHPKGAGSFLDELDADTGAELRRSLERIRVPRGAILCRKGDVSNAMYIVEQGRLRVVHDEAAGRRVIGEIGRGETVGETAMLTGAPRSATVIAVRDTWLLSLSQTAFETIITRSPKAILALARLIARRASAGTATTTTTLPSTLAIVPSSRGIPDLRGFADQLVAALDARAPLLVDRTFGREHGKTSGEQLDEALDRVEAAHPLVVYLADGDDPTWARTCVERADVILRVVYGEDRRPSSVEAGLSTHGRISDTAREELVRIVRDDVKVATGTAAWLAGRSVDAHHVVRAGNRDDIGRLARRAAGNPIAVALSGGGMRGMAHLGLLMALDEARVPVDIVVGTSIGSIVGAQYARGDAPADIVEKVIELVSGSVFDVTPPMVSLLEGRRYRRMMESALGTARLEDLWRPCYLVSADLVSAQVVVHDSGPAWLAVRASGSPPGLLPPVRSGDRLLVDGGVLNNLPTDVARERGRSAIVIASDVSAPGRSTWDMGGTDTLSGWKVLWDRVRGRAIPPGIGELIMRASTLAASRHLAVVGQSGADLYVRPPVDHFGGFDLEAVRAIFATGREHARHLVGQWLDEGRLHVDGWAPRAAPRPVPPAAPTFSTELP